jgi:hypothetical protein
MKLFCPLTRVGTIFIAGTTGMATTITPGGGVCTAGTNTFFPTTPNAFMAEGFAQSPHAFLVLMDSTGTRELYATIFPATEARGVAIVPTPPLPPGRRPHFFSQFSSAVITGVTEDITPVKSAFQTQFGGNTDAYVAKFDPTKPGSASLVYFTYLGGSGVDEGNDIAIYPNGTVAVVGSTTSTNFPIPLSVFPGNRAVQSTLSPPACTGSVICTDAFIATIGNQGKSEGYATYLGGGGVDVATGVALCNTGPCANSIYVSGTTFSADFPTTLNPFSGGPDEFVAKISFPPPLQIKPVLHPPKVNP